MGVTVTVGLLVWIAGSMVEYKIITAVPTLKRLFRGLPGVIISLAIGAAVAFVLGAPTGAGVMLGQLLGLATNEFTFKFYTNMARMNVKKNQVTAKANHFKSEHPGLFREAVEGIRAGVKVIVGVVLAIVWIIGLPVRIVRWVQQGIESTRKVFRHA